MGGDEPSTDERLRALDAEHAKLRERFLKLTEDFNRLRYEMNALEEKVERRT